MPCWLAVGVWITQELLLSSPLNDDCTKGDGSKEGTPGGLRPSEMECSSRVAERQ